MRSHCNPKMSSSTPTINCSHSRLTCCVRLGPIATTSTTRRTDALAAPHRLERQPRVTPSARTIVSASTNSTPDARKDAAAVPTLEMSTGRGYVVLSISGPREDATRRHWAKHQTGASRPPEVHSWRPPGRRTVFVARDARELCGVPSTPRADGLTDDEWPQLARQQSHPREGSEHAVDHSDHRADRSGRDGHLRPWALLALTDRDGARLRPRRTPASSVATARPEGAARPSPRAPKAR